ncbi:hypothetical protein SAMN05216324_101474 [Chryseobacterium limigenitum]|uniref:Uncharacterized protein n=1 Tax=Chryseobacterium limigenitum TaxID=1612149 RepID=A0A1K2IEI2_9FLAO|nr:hypothetical protein SAMN05216324_101474 [Chryseobacterium limigenitum]
MLWRFLSPMQFMQKKLEEATEVQVKIDKDCANGNSVHWCIVDNSFLLYYIVKILTYGKLYKNYTMIILHWCV